MSKKGLDKDGILIGPFKGSNILLGDTSKSFLQGMDNGFFLDDFRGFE